jgi:DNA replication protein DnaC
MTDKQLNQRQISRLIRNNFQYNARINETLSNLDALKPGYNAPVIVQVLANLDQVINGGFIVIAGGIGNGKTTAACLLGIHYFWNTKILPLEPDAFKWYGDMRGIRNIQWEFLVLNVLYYCQKHWDDLDVAVSMPSVNVDFYTSHDILDDEFSDNKGGCGYVKHQTSDLLIIDDLGREPSSKSDWADSVWDKVIDYRYSHKLPTVITTNLTKKELSKRYNERIIDRLNECAKFVIVKEKSFRGAE